MLSQESNDRLTRVGPGTSMGDLLRRYWQPVAVAAEITPEHPKQRVRVMGEDLVVFLDGQGQWGCVEEQCAHRGCSLYYGFVEADGIRCPYHGWKYDAAGACLEQPFEPKGDKFRSQIHLKAYPAQQLAGLIFVYMGPEPRPLLPRWDVLVREDGTRHIEIQPILECNWLQAQENTADTVHTYYLHGEMMQALGLSGGEFYHRPIERYDWNICEWGVNKTLVYGGDHPETEERPPLLFPNMLRIPQGQLECLHWRVPIDDYRTKIFFVGFLPTEDRSQVPVPEYPPVVYLDRMKTPDGEYELTSFYAQDKMAWETQGPLYDRQREHLGASDRGVILFRKLLEEQMDRIEQGESPIALVWEEEKNQCIRFDSTPPILNVEGNRDS